MAAPDNKGQVLCEKCFAFMPPDAEFCAECGAPMTDAPGIGGSDTEVYPELAKANLLRMRKEYKPAEDLCLAILRRYPNNSSANTLLGDIALEKGELEQAAEWYELSLDIVPDSADVAQKLADIREELASRQSQAAVSALGIPPRRAPVGLYAMILLIVAAFVVAAVMINSRARTEPGPDPNKPITVGTSKPDPVPEPVVEKPEVVEYKENEALARTLAEAAGMGNRALIASVGSPGGAVRLILHAVGEQGEWPLRAKLVLEAFKHAANAEKVEIQYLSALQPTPDTKIVTRSTYDRTQSVDFDLTNEALIVETLFGHKIEVPPVETPPTNTITPPLGESGPSDTSTDLPSRG